MMHSEQWVYWMFFAILMMQEPDGSAALWRCQYVAGYVVSVQCEGLDPVALLGSL